MMMQIQTKDPYLKTNSRTITNIQFYNSISIIFLLQKAIIIDYVSFFSKSGISKSKNFECATATIVVSNFYPPAVRCQLYPVFFSSWSADPPTGRGPYVYVVFLERFVDVDYPCLHPQFSLNVNPKIKILKPKIWIPFWIISLITFCWAIYPHSICSCDVRQNDSGL